MTIDIGIDFFPTAYTIDPAALGQAVERAGFDSFWVPDHPVFPTQPTTRNPLRGDGHYPAVFHQMADPFVALSFVAATTSTLKLGTGVTLVTQRHPLTLAKAVSTLDNFSGGRVLLGVGTGGIPEDIEIYGVPFNRRWTYASESVRAMKALWRDGSASFTGRFIKFPEVRCDPLPAQRPNPPVLVGARPTDRTLSYVAEWGDGWLPPSGLPPADLYTARMDLERKCRELGRDPSTLDITVFFVMDISPETQRAYAEAGANRIVIPIYNHPGVKVPMDRWPETRLALLGGLDSPPPTPAQSLETLDRLATLARL